MLRCSSPRPDTLNVSGLSVSSTLSATFFSTSRSSRSRSCRLVTYLPSRPANGPLLTMKSTAMVGSSTEKPASRSSHAGAAPRLAAPAPPEPRQRHDLPGRRRRDLHPREPLEAVELRDLHQREAALG